MARVKLADYIERHNAEAATIIELPDGSEVVVPPAELWSDEAHDAAIAGNIRDSVVLILGADEYARFTKAGGNWRMINGIVAEQQGLDVGKSPASPESSQTTATPSNPTSPATTKSGSRKRSAPRR